MTKEIIVNRKYNLRRNNWLDFADHIQGSKANSFCILTLLYNNTENAQMIIDKLSKESQGKHIDLIVIDNSSKPHYQELNHKNCNIISIRTKQNLGSAGGYALGMEYVISQGYEYMTMIEDDIILTDSETFSETYHHRKDNSAFGPAAGQIIFINPCLNTGGEHSWHVQYACYPVAFIQQIGIIDPRFFFRSEDLEWRIRIEEGIKKLGYHKVIINKNYYHPYLKRVNGSSSRSYFSIRNQLLMFQKHWYHHTYSVLKALLFYIWNSLIHLIIFHNNQFLKAWYYACRDFAMGYDSNTNNTRIQQLSAKHSIGTQAQSLSLTDFHTTYQNYNIVGASNMFSSIDSESLKLSSLSSYSIKHYFTNGSLIGGWNTILLPLFMGSPQIVSVDEFILGSDTLYSSVYKNKNWPIKGIISLFLALVSLIVYLPLLCIILSKTLVTRLLGKHL